jgi:hypothetical protein
MTTMTLDAHLSAPVQIDLCSPCHAFWFDKYESLKLAPGSTLKLIKLIGEQSQGARPPAPVKLECPRCSARLRMTRDMTRNARFSYWRCEKGHGRYISFLDFLREKNFIRPLSAQEMQDLRQNIQTLNCSNCGAPIDLKSSSVCTHCGSPVSMLDLKQPQELLRQLQEAAEPKPINPALPLELAFAKRHIESLSGTRGLDLEWWGDDVSSGLVEAGLGAVVRWLTKSGI